jgi:hypothetical protein
MKKWMAVLVVIFTGVGLLLGCAKSDKQVSSAAAIQAAEAIQDAQGKLNYLIGQAKSFYNSKEFKQAVEVAQYILAKVDQNSLTAKQILQDATAKLQAMANQAVSDVKQKIDSLGQ